MNNRGVMAKKKKTPVAQIEPISLPDEDLAKARAWLEGLNADIAYSQAKRQLAEACGWERSKSNAVIVALHEEGFMAGEKNYFCNPNAPAEPGVVRGAREVSTFFCNNCSMTHNIQRKTGFTHTGTCRKQN